MFEQKITKYQIEEVSLSILIEKEITRKNSTISGWKLKQEILKKPQWNIDPNFQCGICKGIIQNPLKCKNCVQQFCTSCFNNSNRKFKKKQDLDIFKCPKCKQAPLKQESISNDKHKEDRDKIPFNCPQCSEEVKFQNIEDHVTKSCRSFHLLCPSGCSGLKFEDQKALETHLSNACAKVVKSCKCCELNPSYLIRSENHYCEKKIQNLKSQTKQEQNQIYNILNDTQKLLQKSKTEVEKLKTQMKEHMDIEKRLEGEIKALKFTKGIHDGPQNFTDNLETFCKDYLSDAACKALKAHGQIDFGPYPEDLKQETKKFTPWALLPTKEFYQGEINEDSKPTGKGILVDPEHGVSFGYWKNFQVHGKMIHINLQGKKIDGFQKDGNWKGSKHQTKTGNPGGKQKSDPDRFFADLPEMAKKYMSKAACRQLEKHGKIDFGDQPKGFPKQTRKFTTWIQQVNGNWYQGEVNHKNDADGKGIVIAPGQGIGISYWKDGEGLGQRLQLLNNGYKHLQGVPNQHGVSQIIETDPNGKIQSTTIDENMMKFMTEFAKKNY